MVIRTVSLICNPNSSILSITRDTGVMVLDHKVTYVPISQESRIDVHSIRDIHGRDAILWLQSGCVVREGGGLSRLFVEKD